MEGEKTLLSAYASATSKLPTVSVLFFSLSLSLNYILSDHFYGLIR